jgi:hypothetical protein
MQGAESRFKYQYLKKCVSFRASREAYETSREKHKASGEARSVPRTTAGTTGTGFVASDRFRTLTRPTTTKNDKVTIKKRLFARLIATL